MATGPLDALVATVDLPSYDYERSAACNVWPSTIVAAASTVNSWVEDIHSGDNVEKRVKEVMQTFHRSRQLYVKNLPAEAMEEVSVFGQKFVGY